MDRFGTHGIPPAVDNADAKIASPPGFGGYSYGLGGGHNDVSCSTVANKEREMRFCLTATTNHPSELKRLIKTKVESSFA